MKYTEYTRHVKYYEFNEDDLKDLIIDRLYRDKGLAVLRKDISIRDWNSSFFFDRQDIRARVDIV